MKRSGQHGVRTLWPWMVLWGSLWLLLCVIPPAQASWEAYQRAGEEALSEGRHAEARRQFLAAVREARHAGLHGAQLDISLSSLARLNATPSQHVPSRVRATRRSGRRESQRRGVAARWKSTRQHSTLRRQPQTSGHGPSRKQRRTIRREAVLQKQRPQAPRRRLQRTRLKRRESTVARQPQRINQRRRLTPRRPTVRKPPATARQQASRHPTVRPARQVVRRPAHIEKQRDIHRNRRGRQQAPAARRRTGAQRFKRTVPVQKPRLQPGTRHKRHSQQTRTQPGSIVVVQASSTAGLLLGEIRCLMQHGTETASYDVQGHLLLPGAAA